MHSLDQVKVNGKPLVTATNTLIPGNEIETGFSFFDSIYVIIALLILIILVNRRWLFLGYLVFCGIFGIFLCGIGLYSEHSELLWNYNILLFSPLFLTLPFLKPAGLHRMTNLSIALLCIYCIVMVNKPHLLLMLPFILAAFYMLLKISGRSPLKLLTPVK